MFKDEAFKISDHKIEDREENEIGLSWFIFCEISRLSSRLTISEKRWYFESRASRMSIWHDGSSEKQSGPDTLTIGRIMRDCKIILVSFTAVNTSKSRTHVLLFRIIRLSNIHFKLKRDEISWQIFNELWLSLGMKQLIFFCPSTDSCKNSYFFLN